jgi:4-amino-4-deoxy-L-arabinose transferase-like glycosyltransferase
MIERAISKRWLVFLVAVAAHGLYTRGRAIISADGVLYIALSNGFLSGDVSQTFTSEAVRWTKMLYLLILALVRVTTPNHWQIVMVAFNVICSGFFAVMLVDIARRATRSAGPALVALLFYIGCYEILQWMPFILTDLMFAAAAFVPFALVARRVLDPSEPAHPVLLAASLAVAVLTRPPGVVLIPLVLFVELVLAQKRVRARSATIFIVAAALAAVFVRTAIVYQPARWPFDFIRPKIEELASREKKGEVVFDLKESYRPPPRTPIDHVVIEADRFVRFFQFTTPGYSRAHKLINSIYFVLLYALALVGLVAGLRADDPRRRAFVIALAMWIGIFALFQALTVLDYDWRFRLPVLPQCILLAACGVDAIVVWWRARPSREFRAVAVS